jgi:hypothetical protein
MSEKKERSRQQLEVNTDEATLIWDEYKYRHEHCWKTIFKLTSAAVLLGMVPYLDVKLPPSFSYWLISPPLLAVALIGFAMLRMRRELYSLRQVKSIHRQRQSDLYSFSYDEAKQGTFDKHVWWYLGILLALATINIIVGAMHLLRIM